MSATSTSPLHTARAHANKKQTRALSYQDGLATLAADDSDAVRVGRADVDDANSNRPLAGAENKDSVLHSFMYVSIP